jgi:hypothetical protein
VRIWEHELTRKHLSKALRKLRKLNPNVSKAKGEGKARFAPHKALLLLCVVDLAEAGKILSPILLKAPDLRLRFDPICRN